MSRALAIACLALTGCASWFKPSKPEPTPEPAKVEAVTLAHTVPSLPPFGASIGITPEDIAKAVDAARQTVDLTDRSKDSAADRTAKLGALSDLSRVSAYAVALGFLAFLASGFVPIPGLRTNALLTIGIGAAISVAAPWLNDILGDDKTRTISYAAFGIVAISAAVGLGWYIIDKVKDETEHDDGRA